MKIKSFRGTDGLLTIGLLLAALLVSFPFFWMVSTSFKSIQESVIFPPTLIPNEWQLENYQTVLTKGAFGRYLLNSLIYASGVGIGVAITSSLASYAFAFLSFPGKRLLFGLVLATFMIPVELSVIPNFLIINRLGLYDSYSGLILPYLAHPFSIFLLRQAFRTIPKDYLDAASIDGCDQFRFFGKIALPLVWPTIVVVTFLSFVRAWNDLMWPLIAVSGKDMYTVQVGLISYSQEAGSNFPLLMAGSTFAILPVVLVFLLIQRSVIENFAQSGLHGI